MGLVDFFLYLMGLPSSVSFNFLFTFLLNLEDSIRSGLADRGDSSVQENPNKGSEPGMTELDTGGP